MERLRNLPKGTEGDSAAPKSVSAQEQPVAANIEGLYVANILQNQPKTFGIGYEYVVRNEFWLLLSNGRIYFGMPDGDPSQFDFERARREKPEKCGTYKIVGDQIQLKWRGEDVSFRRGQQTVALGRHFSGQTANTIFRRVNPANDLRFNGIFVRRSFADTSSALAEGGVSGETKFAFTRDGRFAVEGFVGFSSKAKGVVAATGSSKAVSTGTYHVRNNVLELTFSDGRRERLFFFRYPQEEEKVICINGVNYLARER